jgi:hypothetical protein
LTSLSNCLNERIPNRNHNKPYLSSGPFCPCLLDRHMHR